LLLEHNSFRISEVDVYARPGQRLAIISATTPTSIIAGVIARPIVTRIGRRTTHAREARPVAVGAATWYTAVARTAAQGAAGYISISATPIGVLRAIFAPGILAQTGAACRAPQMKWLQPWLLVQQCATPGFAALPRSVRKGLIILKNCETHLDRHRRNEIETKRGSGKQWNLA
jgi:hypothetical protein